MPATWYVYERSVSICSIRKALLRARTLYACASPYGCACALCSAPQVRSACSKDEQQHADEVHTTSLWPTIRVSGKGTAQEAASYLILHVVVSPALDLRPKRRNERAHTQYESPVDRELGRALVLTLISTQYSLLAMSVCSPCVYLRYRVPAFFSTHLEGLQFGPCGSGVSLQYAASVRRTRSGPSLCVYLYEEERKAMDKDHACVVIVSGLCWTGEMFSLKNTTRSRFSTRSCGDSVKPL